MTDQNTHNQFHVLIAASGSGQRFGSDTPKQYLKIAGIPILRRTIELFLNCPGLSSLRVIIDPSHADLYHDAVKGLNIPDPIHGSNTRNKSIYNGLKEYSHLKNKDKILIHDAVRPLISHTDILKIVTELNHSEAATLATPIQDTIRKDQTIIERTGLHTTQTPQGFHYKTIIAAHEQNKDLNVTDDTALVSAMNIPVKLVQGSKTNIKITTPEDLKLAEALLNTQSSTIRTGMGFDVHAFAKESDNRPLILCGITIDHPRGLKGHSDADVGLHALTDALLGAIGAGDIGTHFPPSDDNFKNMNSAIFLQKAVELIKNQNARIQNIDITLICENPKIGPHREAMIAKIAKIISLASSKISIKATTTEGLGFTGRGEGIAAQAIATLEVRT